MKQKYQPSQEEIKKAESMMTDEQKEMSEQKEKKIHEKPNFKKDIQDIQKKLGHIRVSLSHLSAQNERYIDVLENGTPEEQKNFADELIESSKEMEDENSKQLTETFSRFDQEVEKAKLNKYGDLRQFLCVQEMNISCTSLDNYLIECKPLNQSIEYFFNGAKMMKRLIDVAEKNNINYTHPQNEINYFGKILIERIRKNKDMNKEEKEKIISKVENLVKK